MMKIHDDSGIIQIYHLYRQSDRDMHVETL